MLYLLGLIIWITLLTVIMFPRNNTPKTKGTTDRKNKGKKQKLRDLGDGRDIMAELKVIQYDYKNRFGKENDYAKEVMSDYYAGKKLDTMMELKPQFRYRENVDESRKTGYLTEVQNISAFSCFGLYWYEKNCAR